MVEMKKSEIDGAIRQAGLEKVNLEGLIAVNGNTFLGSTSVNGVKRYFEIKVIAKADTFDDDEVEAILMERAEVEKRKAEVKAKAAAKAKKDAEKRKKAQAEKA